MEDDITQMLGEIQAIEKTMHIYTRHRQMRTFWKLYVLVLTVLLASEFYLTNGMQRWIGSDALEWNGVDLLLISYGGLLLM